MSASPLQQNAFNAETTQCLTAELTAQFEMSSKGCGNKNKYLKHNDD